MRQILSLSCLALLFTLSCSNPQHILDHIDTDRSWEDLGIPAGFSFSMLNSQELSLTARKSNGLRMGQTPFEVYTRAPKDGGVLIAKGSTNADGELSFSLSLPQKTQSVYVSSPHPAWETGKSLNLTGDPLRTVWEWDISGEPGAPSTPLASGIESCSCPTGGTEISWPAQKDRYTIERGEIACISAATVKSLNKLTIEGELHIVGESVVKLPGDTLEVSPTGKLIVCKGSGLSINTKVSQFEGEVEVYGWLEECRTRVLEYKFLSLGSGALLVNHGHQVYFPENGISYVGSGNTPAYVYVGGRGLNGALSGPVCPNWGADINWNLFGLASSFLSPEENCGGFCDSCPTGDQLSCGDGSTAQLYTSLNAVGLDAEEICGNGIDDNGNGLVDCEESACPPCISADSDLDGVADLVDDFPENSMLSFSRFTPSKDRFLTYAFETSWPEAGDFDFNDLVLDVNYAYNQNPANEVHQLVIHAILRGIGTTDQVAFGISLDDLPASIVKEVRGTHTTGINLSHTGTEEAQQHPVVILFDNAHKLMGTAPGKRVNTETEGSVSLLHTEVSVVITFRYPLKKVGTVNPFVFSKGKREREVHLRGHKPTDLAESTLLGIFDDASFGEDTYKNEKGLPWALLLPEQFAYPKEKHILWEAYPNFATWTESHGTMNQDWYQQRHSVQDMVVPN